MFVTIHLYRDDAAPNSSAAAVVSIGHEANTEFEHPTVPKPEKTFYLQSVEAPSPLREDLINELLRASVESLRNESYSTPSSLGHVTSAVEESYGTLPYWRRVIARLRHAPFKLIYDQREYCGMIDEMERYLGLSRFVSIPPPVDIDPASEPKTEDNVHPPRNRQLVAAEVLTVSLPRLRVIFKSVQAGLLCLAATSIALLVLRHLPPAIGIINLHPFRALTVCLLMTVLAVWISNYVLQWISRKLYERNQTESKLQDLESITKILKSQLEVLASSGYANKTALGTYVRDWISCVEEIDSIWWSPHRRGKSFILAVSPNGKYIAAAKENEPILILDAFSASTLFSLRPGPSKTSALAFSPDGALLAGGCIDGSIWCHKSKSSERKVMSNGHDGEVTGVVFSPDGVRIAASYIDNHITVFDVQKSIVVRQTRRINGQLKSVSFSPDGSIVICGLASGGFAWWVLSSDVDGSSNAEEVGRLLSGLSRHQPDLYREIARMMVTASDPLKRSALIGALRALAPSFSFKEDAELVSSD